MEQNSDKNKVKTEDKDIFSAQTKLPRFLAPQVNLMQVNNEKQLIQDKKVETFTGFSQHPKSFLEPISNEERKIYLFLKLIRTRI